MTREEAIDIIVCLAWHTRPDEEDIEQAIKVLEKEPCEDAISRKALIERINNAEENFKVDNMDSISSDEENPFVDGVLSGVFNIRQMVAQAPSCEPARKKGKWVLHTYMPHKNYCSECEKDSPYNKRWGFCPNCGAEMESEEYAIKHAKEVAEEHTKYNRYGGFESCDECAEEHRQLAEWLKDYKRLKEQEPILDKMRDEVINRYPKNYAGEPEHDNAFEFSLNRILQIIDKYKAEMESGVCKGCHYNDGEVHAECVVCDKAEMEGEE